MVSRGNPLMGNGEKKDVDNPKSREHGSLLRRPESPKPLVGACPAGDCPGIPKTSRAGLAPTKSGESPKPLVGACPAGDCPGIPQTLASRARSYEDRKAPSLRATSAVDFHIPPPSLSVFAPSREQPPFSPFTVFRLSLSASAPPRENRL